MKSSFSYAELDELAGELLPARTVLSTVGLPLNNNNAVGGDGGHGATIVSSCNTSNQLGTPGLVGALGLGSNNPSNTQTCTPAAVASH